MALLYTATCRGVSPRNQRMYGHRRSATLQLVVALTSPLLFFSYFLYPSTMPFSLSRFSVCIVPSHPISPVAAWTTRYFLKNIRLRLTSLRFYIFLLSCSISPRRTSIAKESCIMCSLFHVDANFLPDLTLLYRSPSFSFVFVNESVMFVARILWYNLFANLVQGEKYVRLR